MSSCRVSTILDELMQDLGCYWPLAEPSCRPGRCQAGARLEPCWRSWCRIRWLELHPDPSREKPGVSGQLWLPALAPSWLAGHPRAPIGWASAPAQDFPKQGVGTGGACCLPARIPGGKEGASSPGRHASSLPSSVEGLPTSLVYHRSLAS